MEKASASAWRKFNARYNMIGNVCKTCNTKYFPPRIVCKNCGRNTKMEEFQFNGNGEIFSFTKIHVPSDSFKENAPYIIGVIKLEEGPLVEGHIVESGKEPVIGAKVKQVFRKMYTEGDEGLITYHFKFEII
ncbi:MAG: Zn-ribbon domain-containing OB-fold protein [Candidatus Micrarchaeaceae archaeon]